MIQVKQQSTDTIERITMTAQALSDPQRLRALLALKQGELCVCHLIDLLGLAPSTISKHLAILYSAGLIKRRKEGKWVYYSLATGRTTPLHLRQIIKWANDSLINDNQIATDRISLAKITRKSRTEVCRCYEKK